jgi:hypothetical protein
MGMNLTHYPLPFDLRKYPFSAYIDNRTWWDVRYGGRLDEIIQTNVRKQDFDAQKYLPFIWWEPYQLD